MRSLRFASGFVASALCVLSIVVALALIVGPAAQACVIAWARPSNVVLSAADNGTFGGTSSPFEMETTVLIYPPEEEAFTLRLAYTPGISTNISTCSISPNQHLNAGDADGTLHYSHLTGSLGNDAKDGRVAVSAWNVGHPELCSNTHYRVVDTFFD